MKKILCVMACVLTLCVSSVASAVEWSDYEYINEDGVKVVDIDAYDAAVALERVTADGYENEYLIGAWWYTGADGKQHFDKAGFEADYAKFLAEKQAEQVAPPPASQNPPTENIESAGSSDGEESPPVSNSVGGIPVGSYVDEAGNVFSPDGELLSPGTTPAPNVRPDDTVPGDVLDTENPSADTPAENSAPVYHIADLRNPDNSSVAPLTGLKALIVSIFGEYTPVMTTTAITETVGNETTTSLVDTVAPGAAGVDYAWLSGVLLFAVLLFCLLKLLGGVLK